MPPTNDSAGGLSVFSARVRAALLVGAFALALIALPLSQAGAAVTASQITSPANQTYLLGEENGGKLTIAGTTTGEGAVDINCYYGTNSEEVDPDVAVVNETFSVEVVIDSLHKGPCLLRAVPHGDGSPHEPGEASDPFKGPIVATSEFEPPLDFTDASDYFGISDTVGGRFYFESAGSCGLEGSELFNPTTLAESANLFGCGAAIYFENSEKSRSDLQIDGANAYLPSAARRVEEGIGSVSPAAHKVVSTASLEAKTGLMTINEVEPVVKCAPETISPPTKSSCKEFVSAGVELERTWKTSENDHVAWMTDTWRSTDASAHAMNALYAEELGAEKAEGGGKFEFPGTAAFATAVKTQTVALPTGAGTILYKSDAAESESGDGTHPQGAIVYDSAPSGPAAFVTGSDESSYTAFNMPYDRTIPAGGTYTLRMAFVQGYGLPEVVKLAQEAQASYYPSVSISSPVNGSTTTSSTVTVTGTATDGVGVSSLTVNGNAVSVGAGGAWSTTVALNSGANTITATATNQAGNSKSSSIAFTYTPPKPAPATASQVGNVGGSKGQATLSLACHGTAGTSCKIHVTLTTVEKLRHGHLIGIAAAKTHSKTVTVATLTITIPAGQTVKITLKLNATGRKLLKRFGKLPAHLSAILEGEAGHHTVIAQNLTIKPVPKKHRR
jgi:hypothetical protein